MQGSGTVIKRGAIYHMDFILNGVRIRESTGHTNKRLAKLKMQERQAEELVLQTDAPKAEVVEAAPAGLTMKELLEMWENYGSEKKSLSDDQQRGAALVAFFKPTTLVASITPEDIERFKKNGRQGPRKQRGNATMNRHLVLLKSMLNLAIDRGKVKGLNPFSTVRLFSELNERDRIMTPEEYKLAMANAKPELKALITLGYYTAMRLGEICSLRWSNIDFAEGMIHVEANKTKTKTKRTVPMAQEVIDALEDYDKDKKKESKFFIKTGNESSKLFAKLMKKLKIADLRFHDLRHTALTRLRRAGVDIFTLQKISGHKTLEMLKRYNQIDTDDLKTAMKRLDNPKPKD